MIAVYGLKFILGGIILTAAAVITASWRDSLTLFIIAMIFAVLTVFLTFFYRNPSREIPANPNLILSNADGRVLSVEEIENDYIGGRGYKVSIFLSVMDVHINRIPAAGEVDYVTAREGKYLPAFNDGASEKNFQSEVGLITRHGKIIFKQITGILARRIVNNLNKGLTVEAGEVYGMIHFGSRAELFLPASMKILVKKGDKVKGGTTPIAESAG